MVNKVLNAIIGALHAEFGTGYRIYTEDVPQGLTPPCFLITAIMPIRSKETFVTYRLRQTWVIQYFPASEHSYRNEIHEIIDRLNDCLEVISVEWTEEQTKKTRTEVADTAIVDGVLSYTIRVEDVYYWTHDDDMMEELESAGIEVM